MIDLTPLDVRRKREDFRRVLRGYDPEDVDTFLELAAERLEELVKENLTLRERTERLQEQVSSQLGREKAVQDALVTAQELRDDIRGQARREAEEIVDRAEREAELRRREAETQAQRIVAGADRQLEERGAALEELERKRLRFLRSFRTLLEREMDVVEVEEGREPLESAAVELEFESGRTSKQTAEADAPGAAASAGSPAEPEGEARAGLAPPPELTVDDVPSADEAAGAGDTDDPKRWLSSLVERELNDKGDEDSWS